MKFSEQFHRHLYGQLRGQLGGQLHVHLYNQLDGQFYNLRDQLDQLGDQLCATSSASSFESV